MTTIETYCAKVFCVDNCQTCFQNYTCNLCNAGYYPASNGECVEGTQTNCPDNCVNCNQTSGWCNICAYGYNVQGGKCALNVPLVSLNDCQIAFYEGMCKMCMNGYMVSPTFQCTEAPDITCNVTNCYQCNSTNNFCSVCNLGYTVNTNGGCTQNACNISSCFACSNSTTCSSCATGYALINNTCMWQKYNCEVQNCITCNADNFCAQCMPGYEVYYAKGGAGATCVKLTQAVGHLSEFVKYCNMYGEMALGTGGALFIGCVECMPNFINVFGQCVANLTQSNYSCNLLNCEYCVQNEYCGKCAPGYTVISNAGGQCWKNYSPVPYCALTTPQAMCVLCEEGYALLGYSSCVKIGNITCNITGC